MSTLALSLQRQQFASGSTAVSSVKKINLRLINRLLAVLLIAIFVWYLALINNLAVKGFVLKDLKNQSSTLIKEHKELEVRVSALSSYQQISQRVSELKLVPATDALYLKTNQSLAKK